MISAFYPLQNVEHPLIFLHFQGFPLKKPGVFPLQNRHHMEESNHINPAVRILGSDDPRLGTGDTLMPEADQDGLQLLGILFDAHWKNQQPVYIGIFFFTKKPVCFVGCLHLPVCSYLGFFYHHGLITMIAKLIFIFTRIPGEVIQFDLDFLNPDRHSRFMVYFTYICLKKYPTIFLGF